MKPWILLHAYPCQSVHIEFQLLLGLFWHMPQGTHPKGMQHQKPFFEASIDSVMALQDQRT